MSTHIQEFQNPVGNAGLIWGRLHAERENVCAALLAEGRLTRDNVNGANEKDEVTSGVEFKRRELLQARLRQIDDALDRLLSGAYGRCSDCNTSIDENRLDADPALAFCIACQQYTECEHHFRTL